MNRTHDLLRLLDEGYVANEGVIAGADDRLGIPGTSDHARVISAYVAGGFEIDVLPARGFDIGAARADGLPLSWQSWVTDHRALDRPVGDAWLDRFNGGLLTTCGLENVGGSGRWGPLHGSVGHRPASRVTAHASPREALVELAAEVDCSTYAHGPLRLCRKIVNGLDNLGRPRVQVHDVVKNDSQLEIPVSLMYHINFGAPAVVPETRVELQAQHSSYADPKSAGVDWRRMPDLARSAREVVVEHVGVAADQAGMAKCVLRTRGGQSFGVAWSSTTLPYLHQWMAPARGKWALGIEPSTVPLFGPKRREPYGGAPLVPPGDQRTHMVEITLLRAEEEDTR